MFFKSSKMQTVNRKKINFEKNIFLHSPSRVPTDSYAVAGSCSLALAGERTIVSLEAVNDG